jgi:nucleotide-binding universal stress UspA family protein
VILAPRRIAVPVTLAADSAAVVATATALARALDAELLLVGIAPPAPPARPASQVEDGNWLTADSEQHLIDLLVRERLDELGGDPPPGVRVRSILTWGPPGPALVEAARDERAELIVVGMRRRDSSLAHALNDHADRHVLHHSDVPVLVVPTSPRRSG